MTLELRVDVATRRIEGTNTLRVVGRVAGSDVLTLDALEFVYCRVDTEGVKAEYDGQRLRVRWSTPLAVGEEREVRVAYAVEAPRAGLYGSPHAAADPHASPLVITDAETERARHWMPCVDHPSVRTTLDWSLRSGAEWTALANGDYLGEEQHDDGTKTTRWRLAQRCPAYLACFCVGPFFRVDDATFVGRKGEVPIAYFALPRFEADDLRRAFGRTGDMLAWIEERLDLAFPYTKYFQVAAPGIGGAMENISLVTWDDRALLNEDLALEWTQQLDQINVHEMAHAYFGDAVVCRDFAHAWLKESWAVFMELAWLEHDRGKEDALYDELMCREAYFAECEQRYVRPIITRTFASSWELFDQHLYPGGAVRLAALRAQLGEDTFWRATQTYLQRFEGRVVETSDLIRVFEQVSGRSLHAWFDQWFKQPGYPKLEVTYTPDSAADQATLEVRQTQVDDDAGVGLFRFSLEVDVTWGGETTTHTLHVEGERASLTLPTRKTPDALRVDPRRKVVHALRFEAPQPVLLRQLREGDVFGRVLAARELCRTMRRDNILAIAAAWREEPLWGVRAQIAKALAQANTEEAVETLAHAVKTEADGRALSLTFTAAGSVRDPRVIAALEGRLAKGLPPRAAHAALMSLGKQRKNAPIELLTRRASEVGFGGWAQGGALLGLAESRRGGVVELVLDAVEHGQLAPDARPWGPRALAICLSWLQEGARKQRVREALVDALRDPDPGVAWAAALALIPDNDPACVAAVERFSRTRSDQERVTLERRVEVRRARDAGGNTRDERLDTLERRMRELERQLAAREATPRGGPPSGDDPHG